MAKSKNSVKLPKELTCASCGKLKKETEFFVSYHAIHRVTGRLPYCKECLDDMIRDENKCISIENLQKTLKLIDRPFLYDYWDISVNSNPTSPLGEYMKNLALKQNRSLKWKDSVFNDKEDKNSFLEDDNNIFNNFVITKEMVLKWGKGFRPDQYMMLEDLYQNLYNNYDIDNRSQEEYLKTACLYQLRNIEAIREGNAAEAQKWGSLFDSYMASGKLKPNQLSEADKMGGVTNFATFFQFVEKSNDFIPTFPDLILDDIDYAIYKFINYNRQLMGLPEIQLGEVKNFMTYDYQKGQEIVFPNIEESNGDSNGDSV